MDHPEAKPSRAMPGADSDDPGRVDALARLRHDLRTPASHIQGYAEVLQEEAAELGLRSWIPDLRRIEASGRRLVELIRQELAVDRISAGRVDLRQLHAELRTPLNHALGYSEILLEQTDTEPAARLTSDLLKIQAAARGFLSLLDKLLVPELFPAASDPGTAVVSLGQPDALALSRSTPPVPEAASAPGPAGGVVLIVDDDAANRDLLARRLARQGFEVVIAESGPAGLGVARARRVDLVLLDMIMPGMDGDRVLGELKADAELREIPVIMLSALDEMDSVVRCILMGAEDYLAKPYNAVLLRARINACLEKHRLRRKEQAYLEALELERGKSESLLRNILPSRIAERLKRGETTIVDSLSEVSVLFADVVGFSALASRVSSVELVRFLDDIFTEFDALAEAQGLEKIKTIGDAYMVVGGLPTPRDDHADAVAELALNMLASVAEGFPSRSMPIQIRIGLNTGPVVAGIIGRIKFSYDLSGDTVNLA
ncbi:MAG: adenylate/guanylate cyclase domain-containing protein, partial [Limisphaerales bacterium]